MLLNQDHHTLRYLGEYQSQKCRNEQLVL
jgi:hypothetical protein